MRSDMRCVCVCVCVCVCKVRHEKRCEFCNKYAQLMRDETYAEEIC
jgi:hypothetical protein